MLTLLNHLPIVDNQYLVGGGDGREAMRDDNQRFGLDQRVDGLLNQKLVLWVHIGRSFVQDYDGGILQDCPGDGNSLFFPTGESCPTLPDDGVVSVQAIFQ